MAGIFLHAVTNASSPKFVQMPIRYETPPGIAAVAMDFVYRESQARLTAAEMLPDFARQHRAWLFVPRYDQPEGDLVRHRVGIFPFPFGTPIPAFQENVVASQLIFELNDANEPGTIIAVDILRMQLVGVPDGKRVVYCGRGSSETCKQQDGVIRVAVSPTTELTLDEVEALMGGDDPDARRLLRAP